MYPKGGDGLWGIGADVSLSSDKPELLSINDPTFEKLFVFSDYEDYTNAPNDGSNSSATYEISCKAEELIDPKSEELVNKMLNEFAARQGNGVQESIDMLLTFGGGLGPGTSSQKNYAFSHNKERPSFRTWHDPSQTPLPNAPNLKIYSLYGIGAPTERSYFYRHNLEDAQSAADNDNQNGDGRRASDPPFILDTSVDDPGRNVSHGIRYADGDGSVPLLSLGYMTAGPWRDRKSGLNPSNCRSIIREYVHKPSFDSEDPLRKGRYSAEHVDILGNEEMMEDLVRIVSGYDLEAVDTDKIHSDINGIVQRVKNHPKGGLVRPRKW
jgi:phospholipid:diacylglycerol acyltransferase